MSRGHYATVGSYVAVGAAYDDVWSTQRDAYAKTRGFDWTAPEYLFKSDPQVIPAGALVSKSTTGMPMKIPRTTFAEALQMAAYWTTELERMIGKAKPSLSEVAMGPWFLGAKQGVDVDTQFRSTVARWRAAIDAMSGYLLFGDKQSTYPHNDELWRAAGQLSISLGASQLVPSRWTMLAESTEKAIEDLPKRIEHVPEAVGSGLADLLKNLFKGLFGELGLVVGGVALAGVVAFHYAAKKET